MPAKVSYEQDADRSLIAGRPETHRRLETVSG